MNYWMEYGTSRSADFRKTGYTKSNRLSTLWDNMCTALNMHWLPDSESICANGKTNSNTLENLRYFIPKSSLFDIIKLCTDVIFFLFLSFFYFSLSYTLSLSLGAYVMWEATGPCVNFGEKGRERKNEKVIWNLKWTQMRLNYLLIYSMIS